MQELTKEVAESYLKGYSDGLNAAEKRSKEWKDITPTWKNDNVPDALAPEKKKRGRPRKNP